MTMVGTQLDGDFSLLVGELMAGSSVADPYHVDTDPDPGFEKVRSGSGSRPNVHTDPGKNYMDPDPGKTGFSTRKIFK